MNSEQLMSLLKDPQKIEDIQKVFQDFYQQAKRSNKVAGKYKGREYINLSMQDHLYVEMGVVINWPNQESPYHIHNWVELCYVLSGTCEMIIQDKKFVLEEGQFVLLDTKTPHSVGKTSEKDILINFIFDESYLKSNFFNRISSDNIITKFFINAVNKQAAHDKYIVFDNGSAKSRDLVLAFLCEYYDLSICSEDILNSYMTLIICELIITYQKETYTREEFSNSLLVSNILQYIGNNYVNCSLEGVASEFNLNASYLTTLLKKQTGSSYKKIVQQNRLIQAGRLLTNTDLPVRQIANEIGYENIGFFNKKFREHYGCLPNEYRNQLKNH